jgi:hypothetical protein
MSICEEKIRKKNNQQYLRQSRGKINVLVNSLFLQSLLVQDPGGLRGELSYVQLELRVGDQDQV